MAKMGDVYITDDDWGGLVNVGKGSIDQPTADLSQIEADLAQLPEAVEPHSLGPIAFASTLKVDDFEKAIKQLYQMPTHLIKPSPEAVAFAKAVKALEGKLSSLPYGKSLTIMAPINTPPSFSVADPMPSSFKQLTLTIRLEE